METRWEIKKTDSKIYAFIIAILPCVMMYKVPIIEKGASTVIVLACAILLLSTFNQIDKHNAILLLPCIIFILFVVYRSAGEWIEIVLQISVFIHLYAICSNVMNISAFKKYVMNISMIASACVIFQYLSYILMNYHIPMIAFDFCLDDLAYYRYKPLGGAMYRPSAFFLEPSHMAQYLMLGLALCLLDKQKNYKQAIIITIGMLATTSGMGIVMLICIWGWFYCSQVFQNQNFKLKNILLGAIAALTVVSIATSIPAIQRILARIFGSFGGESSDYNAIHGRLFWWNTYISGLNGKDLLIGKGTAALPDDYLTGFMEILYAYGIIGVFLYYNMLLYLLHKSNNAFSSCTILLVGGLMFFANLTGFIHCIIDIGIVLAVIKENKALSKEDKTEELYHNRYKYIRY